MGNSPTPSPPLIDAPPSTPSLRTLGTGPNQAAPGNDTRFVPSPPGIAGAVPVDDGTSHYQVRKLTLDDLAAAFTITGFSPSEATVLEIGANLVHPAFTASYNRTAAHVTVNDGSGAITIALPGTSFAYDGMGALPANTYNKTALNDGITITLSANEAGGPVKSASLGFQWQARFYYDGVNDPGTYDAAFVQALAGSLLSPTRNQTETFNTSGAQYMFFAFPSAYGGSPANFIDNSTGFAAGFSKVASAIAVTAATATSPTTNYDVWRSDVSGLGVQTIRIS